MNNHQDPAGEIEESPNAPVRVLSERGVERILDIEERRIDRDNRQTALQEKGLELNDAQDQRQAEFHTERIRLEDAADKRRIDLAAKVLGYGGGGLVLVLALFFYMMFWGSESQAQIAIMVFRLIAVAVGGWGVISGLTRLFKSLISSQG